MEAEIRQFLKANMTSEERLQQLVAPTGPDGVHPANGWIYDAELGFKHAKTRHKSDGVGGSATFYDYEPGGARRLVNFPERPCRLHTYGNSFTHCDQVNDGETWQEYLAAHLQEPVRNYGVGGYSVYQAYRRMRLVHQSGVPADYIILNIYSDDHYRNLVSWLRRSDQGFTRPHLRVNVAANTFVERVGPIPSADRMHRMRNLDFLYDTFKDDPLLYYAMALGSETEAAAGYLARACELLGVAMPSGAGSDIEAAAEAVFTEAALFSTRQVVQLVETFCDENRIELMFVLSIAERTLRSVLGGGERFDRGFADWLAARGRPIVDMCDRFEDEFDHSTRETDPFLERYYMGHHKPFGNAYTAWAVADTVVAWLDPKPAPYRQR